MMATRSAAQQSRPQQLWRRLVSPKRLDALHRDPETTAYQLCRELGPCHLTLLGIGAIIGAGIFATIGTAAAGDLARPGAGPALMVSFLITALVCGFTALCYAELAALVPVSGSAYTYAYATLGELVAWIIGWDLVNDTVCVYGKPSVKKRSNRF